MKKALLFQSSICILIFSCSVLAQMPLQLNDYKYLQPMYETTVSIVQALAVQGDMVSDGSGHHYVAPNNSGSITHYLFNNVGTLLSSSTFGTTSSVKPAITGRIGLLHVALHNTNTDRIELYESTDGGSSWGPNPVPFKGVEGGLDGLDAYEDHLGVHITYSSTGTTDGGIYYHMWDVGLGGWADYDETVLGPGNLGSNISPAITTSSSIGGDSAHVLSWVGLRSFKFPASTTDQGAWVASTSPYVNSSRNSLAIMLNEDGSDPPVSGPYMITLLQPSGDTFFRRAYRKYGTTDIWDGSGPETGVPNGKPSVVISPGYPYLLDWPNFVYSDISTASDYRVVLYRMKARGNQPGVFGRVDVNEVTTNNYLQGSESAAGANQGSVVVVWRGHSSNKLYFRRKPYPVVGSMNENYVLTDTNWVLGTTTIASNKVLRLKSGSVTYVAGQFAVSGLGTLVPGKLAFGSGASLIVEPGAKLILQPALGSFTEGGTIECGSGVSITVDEGGVLEANAGSKLYFGSGSSLVVNGTFNSYGSSAKPVVLTRSGASGTWPGIDATDSEALPSILLSYTTISHTDVALDLHTSATLTMDNSSISNSGVGIHIAPAGDSPGDQPSYQFQITNSTFSDIMGIGIDANYTSSLLVTDNTFSAGNPEAVGIQLNTSSPLILGNQIEDFVIGLWCVSSSSPLLENDQIGGYNTIANNYIGVQCDDESPAVLGFLTVFSLDEGGQNIIHDNTAYDVVLLNKSIVSAENNLWTDDFDPPGIFSIGGDCALDYDPWLRPESSPLRSWQGGNELGAEMFAEEGGTPTSSLSPFSTAMRRALAERSSRKYQQAVATLKSIIDDPSASIVAKRWSVVQLLAIAQKIRQANLPAYFLEVLNGQGALQRHIRAALPASRLSNGSWSLALAAFENNIQQYPQTSLERDALYGKFLHALYKARNVGQAFEIASLLQAGFPNSAQDRSARLVLKSHTSRLGARSSASLGANDGLKKTPSLLPREFSLAQNYPNPFNPSTIISYDVPTESKVTLKVFDVLGREAATLVDGFVEAGYHQSVLNATGLASGVYFYRLQAGAYAVTRKLAILK